MAKIYIPDTENGFINFPETIQGMFRTTSLIPYDKENCGAIEIKFGEYNLFLPKNINKKNQKAIYNRLDRLCCKSTCKLFFSRSKQKLAEFMETMYLYSDCDPRCEVAFKIYKNMSKKRRNSQEGDNLGRYLMMNGEKLITMYINEDDKESLIDFLKLQLLTPEELRDIISKESGKMSRDIKRCMVKAMRIAEEEYGLEERRAI